MTTAMALDEHDHDWSEDAVATILALALSRDLFSADDLRREMREAPHCNMVGTAFMNAHRKGYIIRAGDKPSSVKSRNGGRNGTWTIHPNLRRNVA